MNPFEDKRMKKIKRFLTPPESSFIVFKEKGEQR
jgi:hypothetical protein